MVTPKGSMSTKGETLQVSVLPYRPSICPLLVTPHTCNVCGRNLITGLTSAASPRVDTSSICKVGHKLRVSLPLLTCSPSAWPSRLLYRRGRKSRRDLWITLYMSVPHTRLHFEHKNDFTGPRSSYTRLCCALHQAHCRAHIDMFNLQSYKEFSLSYCRLVTDFWNT